MNEAIAIAEESEPTTGRRRIALHEMAGGLLGGALGIGLTALLAPASIAIGRFLEDSVSARATGLLVANAISQLVASWALPLGIAAGVRFAGRRIGEPGSFGRAVAGARLSGLVGMLGLAMIGIPTVLLLVVVPLSAAATLGTLGYRLSAMSGNGRTSRALLAILKAIYDIILVLAILGSVVELIAGITGLTLWLM